MDDAAGRLVSVNVGMPRDVEWEGRTVHTGIWKEPVEGPRTVRRLNVDGDGQGDLVGHGGVNRAVFVYQIESYRYWERFLKRDEFAYGEFGENFTVQGLADAEVCIGDRYRIGTALFEISQPRVTCYRVGIRTDEPRMPSLLVGHHRPGFYLRVLEEGEVQAGDVVKRVARGQEAMSVAEIDALLYLPNRRRRDLARALSIDALSEGWRGSFRELLKRAGDGEQAPPAWPGLRPLRVTAIERESASVISVRLEPTDGEPAAPALPGQFLTVRLHPAASSAPVLRTYSLSGEPNTTSYRISVKREPGGAASGYLHTKLRVGDVIDAGAPRGSFVLRAGDGPVALIRAGVGATPVLAMLHALAAERSPRQVWWLNGSRNGEEHPFRQEADDLLARLPHGHRVVCYSRPGSHDRDYDVAGRLTGAVLHDAGVPPDADFYLCGPAQFMHDISADITARGVAPDRVSMEVFGPGESSTPGIVGAAHRAPHPPAGEPGPGPVISFSRSSVSAAWDPSFASLLEFAEACDVPVQWSCRTGVCHTCETAIVSGQVDYRPDPLEPPPPGTALICCSQPVGEVALDL
jgi:ferredoxin-NADP reductase/MOSC domain-containing protein YiiM/ferredoxin